MTPKELEFMYHLIEQTAEQMYKRGYADGKSKKPLSDQSFTIGRANRLIIKTNLEKSTKKR